MFEKEALLEQLGDGYTNRVVERIRRFAFFPYSVLQSLARDALNEEWGNNLYLLEKYLAVHIPWLLDAWAGIAQSASTEQIEDPEAQPAGGET